jgi:hypothetical protein
VNASRSAHTVIDTPEPVVFSLAMDSYTINSGSVEVLAYWLLICNVKLLISRFNDCCTGKLCVYTILPSKLASARVPTQLPTPRFQVLDSLCFLTLSDSGLSLVNLLHLIDQYEQKPIT